MKTHDEIFSSIVLSSFSFIHGDEYLRLCHRFGSVTAAVQAGPKHWDKKLFRKAPHLSLIEMSWGKACEDAAIDMKYIERHGIKVLGLQMEEYPARLKEIFDPPPIIYVQGETGCLTDFSIAVVGSRRCTYYGEKIAKEISSQLADVGVTTVSGLARGIDGHAHRATLDAKGKTIAVLGCGLKNIYPKEHGSLANRIIKSGALVSEFSFRTPPYPANFPRRNRIIAGLSWGTIVVEGSFRSGSLITAKLATENGKEVMAVPGPIDSPGSEAPNYLIQNGAKCIRSVEDVLDEFKERFKPFNLNDLQKEAQNKRVLSDEAKKMSEYIGSTPVLREVLIRQSGGELSKVSAVLLELEMKGVIKTLAGGLIVKH